MPKPVVMLVAVAVSMVASALAAEVTCPEINGRYERKRMVGTEEKTTTIAQFSRVKGGVTSYSFIEGNRKSANDDEFFPADGKPHRRVVLGIETIVTLRCENGSVSMSLLPADAEKGVEPYWVGYRPLGPTSLEMTSQAAELSGIYHKLE
jgi:hypothetical protein